MIVKSTKTFYLLDEITATKFDEFGMTEGRYDFSASNQGKTLDTIKIGMLYSHYTSISKQLFRIVVNQLPEKLHESNRNDIRLTIVRKRNLSNTLNIPVDKNGAIVL